MGIRAPCENKGLINDLKEKFKNQYTRLVFLSLFRIMTKKDVLKYSGMY